MGVQKLNKRPENEYNSSPLKNLIKGVRIKSSISKKQLRERPIEEADQAEKK